MLFHTANNITDCYSSFCSVHNNNVFTLSAEKCRQGEGGGGVFAGQGGGQRRVEEGRGGGGGGQRPDTYQDANPMKTKHVSPPSKQAAYSPALQNNY